MQLTQELLKVSKIRDAIGQHSQLLLSEIMVFDEITSTNDYFLSSQNFIHGAVCLAERQTAGRGRRGHSWHSPFAANIYLSIAWDFPSFPANLSGLSLLVGIGIASVLSHLGVQNIGLKWPNDVIYEGRKLGGILVETVSTERRCKVVVGIGLNVNMPENAPIDQAWIDLHTILKKKIDRNKVAGILINELLELLSVFQAQGFGKFRDRFNEFDVLYEQAVNVHTSSEIISGRAVGIDPAGQLLVECDGVVRTFNSGEVSIRQAQ